MAFDDVWTQFGRLTHILLAIRPATLLADARSSIAAANVIGAVARHDSAPIFDWLMTLIPLQGISDARAFSYAAQHGNARWAYVDTALRSQPSCPRLRSYWDFADCRYSKGAQSCSEPRHQSACPLPRMKLRKGSLNQAAFSTFLFVRDVCDGDLVGWIDARLAQADLGKVHPRRAASMRAALLDPLRHIFGVSDKLLSMALADLLLAGDPGRERWVTTGASMIAIDSLVHGWLHRTGVLRRLDAEHAFGPACYRPNGCAEIVEGLADRIDARAYNPAFPTTFPRFIQHSIWRFCAEAELNICNGNQIDDRYPCQNCNCTAWSACDRVALHSD